MKTQKAYEHIVDLNTVWKDVNHIPQTNKKVLVVKKNGRVICGYLFIDNHTFTVKIEPFHAITSNISPFNFKLIPVNNGPGSDKEVAKKV